MTKIVNLPDIHLYGGANKGMIIGIVVAVVIIIVIIVILIVVTSQSSTSTTPDSSGSSGTDSAGSGSSGSSGTAGCPASTSGNLLSISNQTKMGSWPDTGMTAFQCQSKCENTPGCSGW